MIETDALLRGDLENGPGCSDGTHLPGLHVLEGGTHHLVRRPEHPQTHCRYPDQRKPTPCRLPQCIDGLTKRIAGHAANLHSWRQDPVSMVERCDGRSSTTADRHRLVPTRDSGILVELHDTHGNRVGSLGDMATDRTGNSCNGAGRYDIIGVMLNRSEGRQRCQRLRCHRSMKSEPDDNGPTVGQPLTERGQRGNKIEVSGSVRDADGGAVEVGEAAQGPGRVACCTDSHRSAIQKGSVENSGGHQGSSQLLVVGS